MGMIGTTKAEVYNVATSTVGMYPSAPLASTLGLEPHHLTMSMLGVHRCRLEIEIYIYIYYGSLCYRL